MQEQGLVSVFPHVAMEEDVYGPHVVAICAAAVHISELGKLVVRYEVCRE